MKLQMLMIPINSLINKRQLCQTTIIITKIKRPLKQNKNNSTNKPTEKKNYKNQLLNNIPKKKKEINIKKKKL